MTGSTRGRPRSVGQRDALRETLGLRAGQFVVLGVMKWHPREDPLTLLDAFSLLRPRVAGVRLILVGDGPLGPEIRARAASLGADVLLPGYVPYSRLPMYYALSDVLRAPGDQRALGGVRQRGHGVRRACRCRG